MAKSSNRYKQKKYVEDKIQHTAESLEKRVGKSAAEIMRGMIGWRRQKAIMDNLDRIASEFQELGEPEELLCEVELRWPRVMYDGVNLENDISIGAAIWILDQMRASDHFFEFTRILPDIEDDEPRSDFFPDEFSHPCYSNDLIFSVVRVLSDRHGLQNFEFINSEVARKAEPSAAFRKLMSMLPKDKVQKACESFKSKQWDLLQRSIRCCRILFEEIQRLDDELGKTINSGYPLLKTPPGMSSFAQSGNIMMMPITNPLLNPSALPTRNPSEGLADQIKKLREKRAMLMDRFADYLHMDRRTITQKTGKRRIADVLEGFTVEDPYEICFAVYALLESDDDSVWLVSSGSRLCLYAVEMLPWYLDDSDWTDEELDSWYEGMTYNTDNWINNVSVKDDLDYYHTTHGKDNLAQIIYKMCRVVVPTGKHPFEKRKKQLIADGMDEAVAKEITKTAELLFLREFQAIPYSQLPYSEEDNEEFDDLGQVLYPYESEPEEENETLETEIAEQDSAEDLSEQLARAKKEIKSLKEALSKEKRDASAEHAKAERELKSLRMEHRELADLRELVFNQQNADPERVETPVKEIEYPYETKKRTVVFGGHDSFLRVFKPMFPDVRFVDASNLSFSPDIIRNADVVWVQNNCISHAQYWNIVKNCKSSGVQLRYFAYASAEKCAEQMVEWDQK